MNHLAHLTRQLTRSDLFLDDDLVVVPDAQLKPAGVDALPPHVLSQRRMLELTAPESSSASSSASAFSSPLSSLPATLGVTELEEKLARALLACRAALEESVGGSDFSSSDSSCDSDDSESDAEMDEDDDLRDGDDASSDADDDDDMESDDEPTIKPDDTYHRRMRRVCVWRDTVVERENSAALLISSPCPSVLSRKRKADDASDADCDLQMCSKRIRVACPVHACTACGWTFSNALALKEHGTPSNPSEACRAAVAYQLEA